MLAQVIMQPTALANSPLFDRVSPLIFNSIYFFYSIAYNKNCKFWMFDRIIRISH